MLLKVRVPIWPYIMFSGVSTQWPESLGAHGLMNRVDQWSPWGCLPVCLYAQALFLHTGHMPRRLKHGHDTWASTWALLLSATSCLTGRRGPLTNIPKYVQYTHGGTCDTWRAIRPHVDPSVYLKHFGTSLLPTMHLSLGNCGRLRKTLL